MIQKDERYLLLIAMICAGIVLAIMGASLATLIGVVLAIIFVVPMRRAIIKEIRDEYINSKRQRGT